MRGRSAIADVSLVESSLNGASGLLEERRI
jgi:hypothetical protein